MRRKSAFRQPVKEFEGEYLLQEHILDREDNYDSIDDNTPEEQAILDQANQDGGKSLVDEAFEVGDRGGQGFLYGQIQTLGYSWSEELFAEYGYEDSPENKAILLPSQIKEEFGFDTKEAMTRGEAAFFEHSTADKYQQEQDFYAASDWRNNPIDTLALWGGMFVGTMTDPITIAASAVLGGAAAAAFPPAAPVAAPVAAALPFIPRLYRGISITMKLARAYAKNVKAAKLAARAAAAVANTAKKNAFTKYAGKVIKDFTYTTAKHGSVNALEELVIHSKEARKGYHYDKNTAVAMGFFAPAILGMAVRSIGGVAKLSAKGTLKTKDIITNYFRTGRGKDEIISAIEYSQPRNTTTPKNKQYGDAAEKQRQVKTIQEEMKPVYDSGKKPPEWEGQPLFSQVNSKLKEFKAEYGNYDDEIEQELRLVIMDYLAKRPKDIKNEEAYLVRAAQKSFIKYHDRVLFPRKTVSIESIDPDLIPKRVTIEQALIRAERADHWDEIKGEFIKTLKEEDKFFFKKFVLNKVEDLKGEAEKLGLSYDAITSKQKRFRAKFIKFGKRLASQESNPKYLEDPIDEAFNKIREGIDINSKEFHADPEVQSAKQLIQNTVFLHKATDGELNLEEMVGKIMLGAWTQGFNPHKVINNFKFLEDTKIFKEKVEGIQKDIKKELGLDKAPNNLVAERLFQIPEGELEDIFKDSKIDTSPPIKRSSEIGKPKVGSPEKEADKILEEMKIAENPVTRSFGQQQEKINKIVDDYKKCKGDL